MNNLLADLGVVSSPSDLTAGGISLNGSTAPNSGSTGLSTPVNTSGGNTNTSGWSLGGFLSGLAGLGTQAANAYATFSNSGKSTSSKKTATATGTASGLSSYMPLLLLGGGGLALLLLLRK